MHCLSLRSQEQTLDCSEVASSPKYGCSGERNSACEAIYHVRYYSLTAINCLPPPPAPSPTQLHRRTHLQPPPYPLPSLFPVVPMQPHRERHTTYHSNCFPSHLNASLLTLNVSPSFFSFLYIFFPPFPSILPYTLHSLSCSMPLPISSTLVYLPYVSLPTLGYGKHGLLLTSSLAPVVGALEVNLLPGLVNCCDIYCSYPPSALTW